MTAHRAYKRPMATITARTELARCAGTQFDPAYVRAFLAIPLPRLLWAMGFGALLMNIPVLRLLAQTTPKALLAAPQTAAAAVAVAGGIALSAPSTAPALAATQTPSPTHSSIGQALGGQPPSGGRAPSVAPGAAAPSLPSGSRPSVPTTGAPVSGPSVTSTNPTASDGDQSPSDSPAAAPAVPKPAADTTAPTVNWLTTPPPVLATSTALVTFDIDDHTATSWCSLDAAAATKCVLNSATYNDLGDGIHTIAVYAVDPTGNQSKTLSSTFRIAADAPTLTSKPPANLALPTASFAWTAVSGLNYQYSVDGGPWTSTSAAGSQSLLVGLGEHTFELRGVDVVGNYTEVRSYTFNVVI